MRHRSWKRGLLALAGLLIGLAPGGPCLAAPAELKKLRVLMVFDTASAELEKSLGVDEWRLEHTLASRIPAGRYEVTVLRGRQVTRERILGYYRNLTTGPDEGLVFFYGGHGALDKVKGHFLELQAGKGKPLLRSELRKAMEARKAGLVVLLTDCCSTPKRLPAVSRDAAASSESARTLHPTVRCLLFQARGTVDVTAATATASWSDNEQGGIFTRALCELLSADLKALDTDRDQFVSWREFFPRLRRGTESTFKQWRKEMRRRGLGDEIDATDQKPYAWALGGAVARPTPAAPEFVVVSLNNKSGEEVRYRYRWSNESAWKSGTLRPGGQAYHARRLGADSRGVVLEAKFDGMNSVVQLKPLRWTGKGQPGYSAGAKYDIELRR